VLRERLTLLLRDGVLRGREEMPLRDLEDVLGRGEVLRDRLKLLLRDGALRGREETPLREREDVLVRGAVLRERSSRLLGDGPLRTCVLRRPGERVSGDRLAAPLLRGRAWAAPPRRCGDSKSRPTGLRRLTP
jgi:hypothetical protein